MFYNAIEKVFKIKKIVLCRMKNEKFSKIDEIS